LAAIKSLWNIDTLILGWIDRGIDYSILNKELKKYNIKNIAFVGDAWKRIYDILSKWGYDINYIISNNYKEIITWCKKIQKNEKFVFCLQQHQVMICLKISKKDEILSLN
jgi:UDP-N-acetylmuramoylalanine--D-glutamate ligase